jgi:hypothetical protein
MAKGMKSEAERRAGWLAKQQKFAEAIAKQRAMRDFQFPEDRPPLRQDSLVKGERPEALRSPGVAYLCNCGRAAREGASCVCEVDPRVLRREVSKTNAQRERRKRSIERKLRGSKIGQEERADLERELAEIQDFYVTARNRTEANLVAEGRVAGKKAGPRQKKLKGKLEAKTVAPGVVRRTRVDGLEAVGDRGVISIWTLGSILLIGVGVYAVYSTFQKEPKA